MDRTIEDRRSGGPMIRRHIPSWIRRELKYIHPSLGVEYRPKENDYGDWVIYENVRTVRPAGVLYGDRLLKVVDLREPVLIIPANHELGSKVLDWVKNNKISRYRTLNDWMAAHGQSNAPRTDAKEMQRHRAEQKRKREYLSRQRTYAAGTFVRTPAEVRAGIDLTGRA